MAKIYAEVRSVETVQGENARGPYHFGRINVIDSENPTAFLQIGCKKEEIPTVNQMVGKTIWLDVALTAKGSIYFVRQSVSSQAKAA